MASFHFSVKKATHGGRRTSALAHQNYIDREGKYKNLGEDKECIYQANSLPKWAKDNPKIFWRAADKHERANACTYKELEFNLMNELPLEENLKIISQLMNAEPMNKFYYSLAVHDKKASSIAGQRNLHVHIMFSERERDNIERSAETFFKRYNPKDPAKGGAKKSRIFVNPKTGKQTITNLRKQYADITNQILKDNGLDLKISPDTLKKQREIALKENRRIDAYLLNREPEKHLGRKRIKQQSILLAYTRESRQINLEKKQLAQKAINTANELYKINKQIEAMKKANKTIPVYTAKQVNHIINTKRFDLEQQIEAQQKDLIALYPKIISGKSAKFMAANIITNGGYKKLHEYKATLIRDSERLASLKKSNAELIAEMKGLSPSSEDYEDKKIAYDRNAKEITELSNQIVKNKKEAYALDNKIITQMKNPTEQTRLNNITKGILQKNLPLKNKYDAMLKNVTSMKQQLAKLTKLQKGVNAQVRLDKGKNITYGVKPSPAPVGSSSTVSMPKSDLDNAKIIAQAFAGNIDLNAPVFRLEDNKQDEFADYYSKNKADETDRGMDL